VKFTGFIIWILSGFSILFYYSCNERSNIYKDSTLVLEESKDLDEEELKNKVNKQTYRLWHSADQFNLSSFDFFGEFYDDRLKFYYSDNPEMKMGDAEIRLLMLYFLDDRLVKIRYHLDKNIEDHLLDSLGLGRLNSKYSRKKYILATEKTLNKIKQYNQQNNYQNEYQIYWDRNVIESSFRVISSSATKFSFDTIPANFVYIDQLKSYSKRLMEIENKRIARLKGDTLLSVIVK